MAARDRGSDDRKLELEDWLLGRQQDNMVGVKF